jgi:hypothetical protein
MCVFETRPALLFVLTFVFIAAKHAHLGGFAWMPRMEDLLGCKERGETLSTPKDSIKDLARRRQTALEVTNTRARPSRHLNGSAISLRVFLHCGAVGRVLQRCPWDHLPLVGFEEWNGGEGTHHHSGGIWDYGRPRAHQRRPAPPASCATFVCVCVYVCVCCMCVCALGVCGCEGQG